MAPSLWSEYFQIWFTNQFTLIFFFFSLSTLLLLKQWCGPILLSVSAVYNSVL
jgi:hypothetical protein